MTKKVHELAKEMGIKSKDLIAKAVSLGISVTSHNNVLSEADIEKIRQDKPKPATKVTSSGKKVPIGRPIVDEDFLARKKPPVGKPVVDEEMLAKRNKKKAEEEAEKPEKDEKDAAVEKLVKKAAAAEAAKEAAEREAAEKAAKEEEARIAAEKKAKEEAEAKASEAAEEETPEKSAEKDTEEKEAAEEKQDAKTSDETKAEEDKPKEPKTIKKDKPKGPVIVKKAADVAREEEERKTARKARQAERKAEREAQKAERSEKANPRRRAKDGQETEGRGGRSPRSVRTAPSGDGPGRGRPGRRDDRRRGPREDRTKFDKFEQKSLEKKERKKYNKPKEVEPEIEEEEIPEGTIKIDVPITVAGFCEQAEVSTSKVIMSLMKLGIMANINQNIDEDTLLVLAEDLGIDVVIGHVQEEEKEEGIEDFKDREKDLEARPPIITVMGHVDHGKTSLLDAIRETNVTAGESGGITQHIGASEVSINGQKIVFLDTPGHEAFTAMRARGAHVTDIAVLVVAADDSVKPQTIESISHAKAAGVPMIVAINKIDKPGANPDMVKKDLSENGVLVEDWGGEVISVPVSAKTGEGITTLLEMILLQAEVLELKANPNRLALGSVIEARLDKAKGPVASLLVLNGTLQAGQSIVAGTCAGRIRLMTDDRGKTIKKAGPATAVEVLGLTDVPQAGDEFNAVRDDKVAREIAEHRQEKLRDEVMAKTSSMTLDKLFSQIQEGETKELNLVIKGDVQGSVGALITSLEKLNNDQVKVNVVHSGVGTVSESDIMLAETSDAVIIGFNVRPSTAVTTMASQHGVEIRLYRVIYDVINDVEAAMKGMLDPEFREEVLGKAEVRDTFKVPGVGIIAGSYITEGKVVRNEDIRLVRDGIVIHEGKISSLKRFKDDAKEVAQGFECGIGIEDYNDIKEGDVIECFTMVEIER